MKLFKSLTVALILSTILLSISFAASLDQYAEQVPTSYDLIIQPIFQHRDTMILDLDGSPLYGEHSWDSPHEVESFEDRLSLIFAIDIVPMRVLQ